MNQAHDMGGWSIREEASLAAHNTMRVAARARWLIELHDATRLPEVLSQPAIRSAPLLVLGQGSNVLFAGDFPGTVLVIATRGVTLEEDSDAVHMAVAAGECWDDFVRWSLAQGHPGLENLVLIPGLVGAAPMQNIGAYGVEVARFIESVETWDRESAAPAVLSAGECAFGYRDSRFKREPDRHVITGVRFCLPRRHELQLGYAGLEQELRRMGVAQPGAFHVAEAVVRLRTRKLPDPAVIGNAGSFFKNPLIEASAAAALVAEHPQMPHWPDPDGPTKLSAAWMIESCGFKGLREGDAGISNRHALVLVNHGSATGVQLWNLAQQVIAGVQQRFGVELEPEPRIIGG